MAASRAETVMQFVLRHSDLKSDVKAICSLLCVSQAVASSVHASCAGCLALEVGTGLLGQTQTGNPQQLQWLSQHAVLLHDLKHCNYGHIETGSGLAAALRAAASTPLGLRLQSLTSPSISVLEAAALSSHLTQLQLNLHASALGWPERSGHESGMTAVRRQQQARTAITGLSSQLRSLKLEAFLGFFYGNEWTPKSQPQQFDQGSEAGKGFAPFLQDVLPQMTALTRLAAGDLRESRVLKYAPAQLQELEASCMVQDSSGGQELGHLTVCTALILQRRPLYGLPFQHLDVAYGWNVVRPEDILPPNLHKLNIVGCESATPLLALSRLSELSIRPYCCMQASELSRLSALTCLQKAMLGYSWEHTIGGRHHGHAADSAAAGWAAVPGLEELALVGQLVCTYSDTLKCLSKLTALTQLSWRDSYITKSPWLNGPIDAPADAGLQQVATALPTSLCALDLNSFIPECLDEPAVLAGLWALVQAIGAWPHLESCSISQDVDNWSADGQALFERVKDGDADSDDIDAFAVDYWASEGSDQGGDSDDEVPWDEVSVEVMAADPVSEQEHLGGVYDDDVDDDAVWEGDGDDAQVQPM